VRCLPKTLAGLTAGLVLSTVAGAQAWLAPKGEAWLTFGYGNIYSAHHYGLGVKPPDPSAGVTRNQTLGLILGYGITDRLAMNVSIPFVDSIYHGTKEHRDLNGVILTPDDHHYHGTFQDYRINLGYQALSGTVSVAPFATVVIPSHGYATLSHAAPGKGLNQLLLGFAAGAALDRIVPGTFVEMYYDYAFVEEVVNINTNRSDFGFQAGYYITPTLGVRFISAGYYTHGGIPFKTPNDLLASHPEQYAHHDQIAKSSIGTVGGGLTYVLTGSTEISVSYLRSIYGRTGHKIDDGVGFGFSWSFSPEQIIRRAFPPKPVDAGFDKR